MRKTFRTIGAFALCAVLLPVFASCSDDDGNYEPDGRPDVPEITEDGSASGDGTYLRVTSIEGLPFYYDEKGRLEGVGSYVSIDYSRGKFVSSDFDDTGEEMNIRFNGKGYVSEMSASWNYEDDEYDESFKGSGKKTFEYNGTGNLVKYTSTLSETGYEDGEKVSYEDRFTLNCKWSGGKLISATIEGYDKINGRKEPYTEKYTYEYGHTLNKYCQMPLAISDNILWASTFNAFAAAGLFGYGPSMLPTECEEEDEDGYSDRDNFGYSLNSNGSIAIESINGYTYNWGYGEYTRGMFEEIPMEKHSVRSLFKRGGDRK